MSIESAAIELRAKTITQIQVETATTWADRAFTAFGFYKTTGVLQWLLDALEYHHEAVEHAALAEGHLSDEAKAALARAWQAKAGLGL